MNESFSQNSLISLFKKSQNLFQNGRLTQSRQIYEGIIKSSSIQLLPTLHYESLLNLSTIYFQQNDVENARKILKTGIQLNQQRYEAFYNLGIINYHSRMFFVQIIRSLQYCLSLLYLQLGTLTSSLKLLNKSISLNSLNPKAYIHRALIYEQKSKIQLAEYQFETLTQKNDLLQFNPIMMIEIYYQKVLFYRRIKQIKKMEQNLKLYTKLKKNLKLQKEGGDKMQRMMNLKIKEIFESQNERYSDQAQLKQTIMNLIRQIGNLIKQVQQQREIRKRQYVERRNLQQQEGIKQNFEKGQFEKTSKREQEDVLLLQPSSIDDYQTQNKQNVSQKQSDNQQYQSISIHQDEDSAILNRKIQQLQRQIKLSGGNIPEFKDTSKNYEEEENFLQNQIEKTIQEINNKKLLAKTQILKQPTTLKSSINENIHLSVSGSGSQWRKSSIHDDQITLRSKISDSYEINLSEMRTYDTFQLEIRSVSMFDQNCPKREAFIKIKYMEKVLLTDKCKNEKLTWNHNFEKQTIFHPSQEQEDQRIYHLSVELYAKEGGWLSWNRDVLIGAGTIKLTEKGTTKCTLQHNLRKVGMLYYKSKLKKHPTQNGS